MWLQISCDSATCNWNKKCNNKTCWYECKNYSYKKDYSWNPSTCIWENCKYLKSISDTSVIACDKIVSVMGGTVSMIITNTIAANVSINSDVEKVRYKIDCYILHTVLLGIILLLIITMIWYHYAKQKVVNSLTI